MTHPTTVQPNSRFRMKIPVKSRFRCPMIDGKKYISIAKSRSVIAVLLPL
jgi:hypothetical protein